MKLTTPDHHCRCHQRPYCLQVHLHPCFCRKRSHAQARPDGRWVLDWHCCGSLGYCLDYFYGNPCVQQSSQSDGKSVLHVDLKNASCLLHINRLHYSRAGSVLVFPVSSGYISTGDCGSHRPGRFSCSFSTQCAFALA